MNNKKMKSNFIVQGSILAAASIISRIIGMLYRIPLTGIIGDAGNGIYSVAYEVYAILLLVSSYSLPLAVSKLVSSKMAVGERKNAYKYFKSALLFAIIIGSLVTVFTYSFAKFIAGTVMSSPMSTLSLRILAPAILIGSVMGVLRGYFQGVGSMIPTAISQLIEQIINAVVSVAMAYTLFQYGTKVSNIIKVKGYGAAYGAAGGTLGTVAGMVAGLLFLMALMLMYRKVLMQSMKKDKNQSTDSIGTIYRMLLLTILPVIMSTAVYNICTVLDQGIFNKILSIQGYSVEEYNALWGIFSGKYRLLTNVPVSIASALASSTVITIAAAKALKNRKEIIRKTRTCIRFAMIITIPSAVGLAVLASPILQLLWHDERAIAANLFYLGTIAVILYSLSTLTNGILQGINKMHVPVKNALIALVVHIILLVVLLVVFKLHVYAVLFAHILFALLMCILNGFAISRYIKGYKQEITKTFLIPAASSAVMGIVIFFGYRLLMLAFGSNALATIIMILVGVMIYFIMMLIMGGISESELYSIPKGRLLVRIAKRIHLLR